MKESQLSKKKVNFIAESIPKEKAKLKKAAKLAAKKKKETKVKNSQTKTIITLVTIGLFIATFIGGMQFEKSQQATIKAKAAKLVKSVSVVKEKQ